MTRGGWPPRVSRKPWVEAPAPRGLPATLADLLGRLQDEPERRMAVYEASECGASMRDLLVMGGFLRGPPSYDATGGCPCERCRARRIREGFAP